MKISFQFDFYYIWGTATSTAEFNFSYVSYRLCRCKSKRGVFKGVFSVIHILPAFEGSILDYHTKKEYRRDVVDRDILSLSVVILYTTLNCRQYVLYYTEYLFNQYTILLFINKYQKIHWLNSSHCEVFAISSSTASSLTSAKAIVTVVWCFCFWRKLY